MAKPLFFDIYIWIKLKTIFSTKSFNKTFGYPIDLATYYIIDLTFSLFVYTTYL
jgi:hypothetical protein